jgi:hypothetical protein
LSTPPLYTLLTRAGLEWNTVPERGQYRAIYIGIYKWG